MFRTNLFVSPKMSEVKYHIKRILSGQNVFSVLVHECSYTSTNSRLQGAGKKRNYCKKAEITGLSNSEADALCKPADAATKDFLFQQTMYRIKDPRKSLPFYTGVLGMTLLLKLDFPDDKFSLYFMGYENPANMPKDQKERTKWAMSRKATVELTHNWGTESKPDQAYHNGNSDPRGFGHIGLMVPDVYAACKRFEELGVDFVKKPDDGRMKGLAFIKEPDGYWIEIFNANTINDVIRDMISK